MKEERERNGKYCVQKNRATSQRQVKCSMREIIIQHKTQIKERKNHKIEAEEKEEAAWSLMEVKKQTKL
jgi:ribosomal silencing factor RsfS